MTGDLGHLDGVGAVVGDDAVVGFAVEEIDEALLGFADFFPGADGGVEGLDEAGVEDRSFPYSWRDISASCAEDWVG